MMQSWTSTSYSQITIEKFYKNEALMEINSIISRYLTFSLY
jgi:phage portal protein BeeE